MTINLQSMIHTLNQADKYTIITSFIRSSMIIPVIILIFTEECSYIGYVDLKKFYCQSLNPVDSVHLLILRNYG